MWKNLSLDRLLESKLYNRRRDQVFLHNRLCSKIENYEEILCGIRLFDRSKEERIKGSESAYTVDPHPTGRLRFGFTLRNSFSRTISCAVGI